MCADDQHRQPAKHCGSGGCDDDADDGGAAANDRDVREATGTTTQSSSGKNLGRRHRPTLKIFAKSSVVALPERESMSADVLVYYRGARVPNTPQFIRVVPLPMCKNLLQQQQ